MIRSSCQHKWLFSRHVQMLLHTIVSYSGEQGADLRDSCCMCVVLVAYSLVPAEHGLLHVSHTHLVRLGPVL
jgi:hypothetical protein